MTKQIFVSLALSILVFGSSPAMAGEGSRCHFHGNTPAQEQTVLMCAEQRRDLYLEQGTIEASWQGAQPEAIEVIDGDEGQEWRVLFRNESASERGKQTLYMFFTLPGNFIAANYSGK